MGQRNAIWRHGTVYGAGMMLNRVAGFLLIPILLHNLSAKEWGVYSLILAISQFLIVVPAVMIDTTARLHFDQPDKASQNAVMAATLAIFLLMSGAILVLAYPLALLVGHVVFHGQTYASALVVANIGLIFELLFEIELNYLRIRKRSGLFAAASLTRSLLQFATAILFVVGFGMGVMGVVLGGAIAVAAVSTPIAVAMGLRSGLGLARPIATEMRRLGLPLVPAWIAKASLDLLEPYLLNVLANLSTVGLYAVASKLADQLRVLVTGPFAQIWGVSIFEAGLDRERSLEVHRILAYFFFLLTAAALGLALFAPEIVRIVAAREFWSAASVVPILALTQILKLTNFHFEVALIERKRTAYLPFVNGGAVLGAVALYWFLVPRLGILGAALAGVGTQGIRLGTSVWFAARCSTYAKLFPWRSIGTLLGMAAACYLLGSGLFGAETLWAILGKAGLLVAFLGLGFGSPVFRGWNRRGFFRGFGRHWMRARAVAARAAGRTD